MKIYNDQTRGYKIDIFINGKYHCSTDWQRTCKAAKAWFIKCNSSINPDSVKCYFDKIGTDKIVSSLYYTK
jgi:hypothetical protein